MKSRYNILRNDKVIFEDLSEMEYFDMMEDLAVEFYQTGTPHPDEITYEMVEWKLQLLIREPLIHRWSS